MKPKLNGIKTTVQALNPHAEFGLEEKNEIIPAIFQKNKELMQMVLCLVTLHL